MKSIYALLVIFLLSCSTSALAFVKSAFEFERENYEDDAGTTDQVLKEKVAQVIPDRPVVSYKNPIPVKQYSTLPGTKMGLMKKDEEDSEFEREEYQQEKAVSDKTRETSTKAIKLSDAAKEDNFLAGFYIRMGAGSGVVPNSPLTPFRISSLPPTLPINADLSSAPNRVWFYALTQDRDVFQAKEYPQTYQSATTLSSSPVFEGAIGYGVNDYVDLEVMGISSSYYYAINAPLAMSLQNDFANTGGDGYWGASLQLNKQYTIDTNAYIVAANLKLPFESKFKPFLSGGFGLVKVKESETIFASNIYACNQDGGDLRGCVIDLESGSDQQTKDTFYQKTIISKKIPIYLIGIGLEYDFNENLSADIRYKLVQSLGKTPLTNKRLSHHNLTAGMKYKF